MNFDFKIGLDELEKKKKFYEDQQNINSKLSKDIEFLDSKISDLSMKLVNEENHKRSDQDELNALKRNLERTGIDLNRARSELGDMKHKITDKQAQ